MRNFAHYTQNLDFSVDSKLHEGRSRSLLPSHAMLIGYSTGATGMSSKVLSPIIMGMVRVGHLPGLTKSRQKEP